MSKAAPKGDRAVMAQKKPGKLSSGEPWENLEFYPTPPWATRALFEHVLTWRMRDSIDAGWIWEPCAGLGHMVETLREYADCVRGTDIFSYPGAPVDIQTVDFLDPAATWPFAGRIWIVTNPPFGPAVNLLEKAMSLPNVDGVAFLLRIQWMTGENRYARVFNRWPPSVIAPFVERVPMCLGGYDMNGSTATDYAWFVWECGPVQRSTQLCFIPPCRKRLMRKGDKKLAARHVPGWIPPSRLKKLSPDQGSLSIP